MKSKFGMTLVICFLLSLISCGNFFDSTFEDQIEETNLEEGDIDSDKAYIVIKVLEPGENVNGKNARLLSRAVTSGVTSSLFSHITFSGTRDDGKTLDPVEAASFAELSEQTIEVEPGDWTFNLEAWLGKTDSAEGEKYTAVKNLSVVAGSNELKMSLAADSSSAAAPTFHPGSWEVSVKFPADTIDQVSVWLLNYSDFAVAGANPANLTKLYSETFVKGSDFTGSGQKSIRSGETNRACGNYIVYVSFLKNVGQQGSSQECEIINTWGEFMRINPGVKSTGTITLPNADKTYTIQYNLGGAQWNTSSTENIQISYSRNSGTGGVITLPTEAAFVNRGALYSFEGWYTDENFASGTGPVTSFNVSDAENKIFYAKWHEPVFDIYISSTGDDSNDGSASHPLKNASAAYAKFDDLDATDSNGNIRNTIHILSDYTGTNKIATTWGDGSKTGMLVKFVGEKGGVANADVTLEVDVSSCPDSNGNMVAQTFIYIENNQKMRFSHINFTSSQTHEQPNGYACLFADDDTELYFEDSTIKGYVANGCAGICAEGTVYLKNCEISGNKAIDGDTDPDKVWGCAVNVGVGQLHISGSVIINDNHIYGQPESSSYNLYIGTNDDNGTPVFHPIIIDDQITGSQIGVLLSDDTGTFTEGFTTKMPAANPADFFHSDKNFEIRLVTGEARISSVMKIYVSSLSASPAGDDTNGNGSQTSPYQTLAKAIQKITQINNNQTDATIYVTGDVTSNTTIVDGTTGGSQLIANSLIIEGTTATSALNGNASGTVLDLRTSVPVTLKNLTIKNGQTSTRGGGLYIDGSTVEINNCIIEDNSAVIQGGGVYVAASSSLTMNGTDSFIRNNRIVGAPSSPITPETKKSGGGVFVAQGGIFTMNAGTIRGNGATDSAGGVYTRGSITMEGGTITTNKRYTYNADQTTLDSNFTSSTHCDNVEVGIHGVFELKDGTITSEFTETSGTSSCGGVCLYATSAYSDPSGTARFNMSGGSIEGISSQKGAVYLYGNPSTTSSFNLEVNMSGGSITGNTIANSGGAVYLGACSHFTMTGGEISGNHAASGGGIFLEGSADTNAPTITLGASGTTSEIIIKDNTYGTANTEGNIKLRTADVITVAGVLSTESEVGITRGGTFSATPFTSGFGTTNSGTAPSDIFTSDEGYSIIAGSGGEAAFLTSSASGTIYAPGDYNFTLAASRNTVTVGKAATVTVTPTITRTEPNGGTTDLFYNPADHKLYLDSAFEHPEGSDREVIWIASLWCGSEIEEENLAAGIDANANKFTIPALNFENTYTLNVSASYLGYTHNASFTLQCSENGVATLSTPLTIEAAVASAVVTFDNKASGPVTYKVNGGAEQTIASGAVSNITLSSIGDKVEFFGNNTVYGNSSNNSSSISCSNDCYVYGNIMSLVNSTGFETANTLTGSYAFAYLFHNNTKLKNKTGADLLLPATTLSEACYRNLFSGCTSLTTAPELPATTLAYDCYFAMFSGCSNLTEAPTLPATTLASNCYILMFSDCTSLILAPALPATTLKTYCYDNMFSGCTSLTTAPILPATTLEDYCYVDMFLGCTSLNSITCLATDISATRCVTQWLSNVASTGTFTKASSMSGWSIGEDGIPSGWTVQDAP